MAPQYLTICSIAKTSGTHVQRVMMVPNGQYGVAKVADLRFSSGIRAAKAELAFLRHCSAANPHAFVVPWLGSNWSSNAVFLFADAAACNLQQYVLGQRQLGNELLQSAVRSIALQLLRALVWLHEELLFIHG